MQAKPILFSGPMVRAILDGCKTQTRRVVKPQPEPVTSHRDCSPWIGRLTDRDYAITWCTPKADGGIYKDRDAHSPFRCPYGRPGDLLWVRETWADLRGMGFDTDFAYRANSLKGDHEDADSKRCRLDFGVKWKPSIFMPRFASRLTLRITDVRVERVQDISHGDAIAEGLDTSDTRLSWEVREQHALIPFRRLWDSINAKRGYSWESNPWVWAIGFEAIRANVDEAMRSIEQEVQG